jgi:dynein heavy chain 1, cytosolic
VSIQVQDLKYATLATVSRCGMVWFSEDVLSTEMIFENFINRLRHLSLDEGEEEANFKKEKEEDMSPAIKVQRETASILQPFFAPDGLVVRCLEFATQQEHIMDFTRLRALNSLFSMMNQGVRNILQYNHSHSDFPLPPEQVDHYIQRYLVYALLWSFAGDAKLKVRSDFGDFIRSIATIPLPPTSNMPIIDYEVKFSKKDLEFG